MKYARRVDGWGTRRKRYARMNKTSRTRRGFGKRVVLVLMVGWTFFEEIAARLNVADDREQDLRGRHDCLACMMNRLKLELALPALRQVSLARLPGQARVGVFHLSRYTREQLRAMVRAIFYG